VVVVVGGLLITGALVAATWSINQANEDRLLDQRVGEAGAVLQAGLPTVQAPLVAGAEVAEASNGQDTESFARLMGPFVGEQARFVSASLWRLDGSDLEPVFVVGAPPGLAAQPPEEVRAFLERSASTPLLAVVGFLDGDEPRVGYSFDSSRPQPRFLAYAEGALPKDRTSVIRSDNAFHGLDYALYLGDTETPGQLLIASTAHLPIDGRRASRAVPFGDSTLLLVMSPTGHQGGTLLAVLPWLLLAGGVILTATAGLLVARMQRRRYQAERLAAENAGLYQDQHRVARTLQHSLLPDSLPAVDGAELAVRYSPGVQGMEIGGDWYDALLVNQSCLLLTVGDVSGRGLRAASVMASLRFAARAFASQGDQPAVILTKLNDLTEPDPHGHFATAVCALVDLKDRTVTVASAGHPRPILLNGHNGSFIDTTPGRPIGITPGAAYSQTTAPLPAMGTLLLYTDGLFERRAEPIDVGLERLLRAATQAQGRLDNLLDTTVAELTAGDTHDDVAILGLQWPT
jgi:serine phosphatase RsbU (regulator of sigma subunit)